MFFLSTFVFYAAGYMLLPTLPLILSSRGASPAEVGVIMGAFTTASLACRAPVGALLARRSPAPLLRYGQALVGAGFLAYLLGGLAAPLAGRIVQGVGLALFNTAAYVYLARWGGERRRAEFISLFGLSANVAMAVAPAAGSLLLNHAGEMWLYTAGAALATAGLLTVPRITAGPPEGAVARLWEPRAWRPAAAMLGLAAAYGSVMVFVPLAVKAAGLQNGWAFFSIYAASIIATRLATRRLLDRGSRLFWAAAGCAGMAAALCLLALAHSWPLFLTSAMLFGIGVGTGHPSLMAYLLETVSDEHRSGAAALGTSAFDLGASGGAAAAGLIADQTTFGMAFTVGAVILAAGWMPLALKRPTRSP